MWTKRRILFTIAACLIVTIAYVTYCWTLRPWTAVTPYTVPGELGQYTGQMRGRLYHGHGTFSSMGATYTGDWHRGTMQGYGVMTFHDGSRYEGQWQDGSMHGEGTFYGPDGQVIAAGTWHYGDHHDDCSNCNH